MNNFLIGGKNADSIKSTNKISKNKKSKDTISKDKKSKDKKSKDKEVNMSKNVSIKNVSTNNNNSNLNTSLNFNKFLTNALKDKELKLKGDKNNNIKFFKNYENSFDDIISFSKKFTKKDLTDIDTIIFHDENNDGFFSASIAYNYLKIQSPNRDIQIIPEKPGKLTFLDKIKDRNIIILDLSLNEMFLKKVISVAKSYIVIDDHSATLLNDKNIFNGKSHSACGYTWKFFYPKLDIPNTIVYIDSSDGKLFLNFIPKSFTTLLAQSTGIRYTHAKSKLIGEKKRNGELLKELWEIIIDDSKLKLLILVGYYYHEFSENLKEQIAINAVPSTFQGYNVGLLNYNSPAITKAVARQIITNFKNKGMPIDFAVCWGYEHINNCYRIQIMDDHKQTKIHMGNMAQRLGAIGGHPKGGNGHPHVGNFYWPRNDKYDIWDLFKNDYLGSF
jgi:hypothetical protein